MVAKVRTVAFQGVEVIEVETQVTIASGLPVFTIVGLPDKAVAESRERVRAALASLGLGLPTKRITVNLAPADVVKEGSHFDLPIALGLLAAMEALPADELGSYTALGELALDGSLTGVAHGAWGIGARRVADRCRWGSARRACRGGPRQRGDLSTIHRFSAETLDRLEIDR
jgi:magnesium chelatase family protein